MLLLSLQGTGGRPPGAHLQAFPSRSASLGGGPWGPTGEAAHPKGSEGRHSKFSHRQPGFEASSGNSWNLPIFHPRGRSTAPITKPGIQPSWCFVESLFVGLRQKPAKNGSKPGPVMPFSDLHTGKQATGPRWQGQGRVQPAHRTRYTGKAGGGHGPWTRSLSSRSSSRNASWDQRGGLGARPLKRRTITPKG